jgi:hypothetical protein
MSHGLTTHTIVAASMRPLCSSRRDDEMMPARVSPGAREGQRSRRKEYACGAQISAANGSSLVEVLVCALPALANSYLSLPFGCAVEQRSRAKIRGHWTVRGSQC